MNKLTCLAALTLASSSLFTAAQAQTVRAESARPYFGIQAAYTLSAPQPIQLGVQYGFDRLLGPAGLRLSAGLTLGAGGPSFTSQLNALARVSASERIQLYGGPGATLRSENGSQRPLTYGPNGVLGLEYAVAPNLWVGLEGQVDYRLGAAPGATPWRFGLSLVLRQRL